MAESMYKKLKKQNGEKFAQTIRNFHNGILEIPDLDVILRHAGRDAAPLLPYLMSLLASNDDTPAADAPAADPYVLLDEAGYKAFYADTLEKQNSIEGYFAKGELLCTFNDAARHQNYHIIHAIRKDADQIKRDDFKGKEKREDAYGTSVISIQMLKTGGFISIKNRYNHSVNACDNTFGSNPDNIIKGLTAALKDHFNVDFTAPNDLPDSYFLCGKQVFKYHRERNGFYYGDQAWAKDGKIHKVDRAVGALFDTFLFDNKTKTLEHIDTEGEDSFPDDFNRCYGGNPALALDKNGSLTLNDEVIIGAEKSQIKTLFLPGLIAMSKRSLYNAFTLKTFEAPDLIFMSYGCLYDVPKLKSINARALKSMDCNCVYHAPALTSLNVLNLVSMDNSCVYSAPVLMQVEAPALISTGQDCFFDSDRTKFELPDGQYLPRSWKKQVKQAAQPLMQPRR